MAVCKICGKEFEPVGDIKSYLEDSTEIQDYKVCNICKLKNNRKTINKKLRRISNG